MAQSGIHSTGRGGAGNIGQDNNVYVDGDIIREGVAGESQNADYSAGRGGAGNIHHVSKPGVASEEVVPESATRAPGADYENYHTGRGGEGNVHKDKYGGHSHAQKEGKEHEGGLQGLMEKAKHAVGLDRKEKTPTPEPGAK